MNKTLAWCVFIVSTGAWVVLSLTAPWVLGDKNIFLKDFVGNNYLQFIGIIVTITLASTASIHLEFNKIEDIAKQSILSGSRIAVRRSAFSLILMLAIGVVVAVVKPHLPETDISTSFVNGLALLTIFFSILVLIDITKLVFKIEPIFKLFPSGTEADGAAKKR